MSLERDAIARAFGRPFTEPPKRAPAKRISFTLAGIALLGAGLIANERLSGAAWANKGVECTATTTTKDSLIDNGQPKTGVPETVTLEFLAGNKVRFVNSMIETMAPNAAAPITTTDQTYVIGDQQNWPNGVQKQSNGDVHRSSGLIINRVTGDLFSELDSSGTLSSGTTWWSSYTTTGKCHPVTIAAKM
jgi:hypothetical protein